MIFIEEIAEFNREDIQATLTPYLVHPSIVVVLPKSGPRYLSATENLINDYGAAAYAGQLFGTYAPDTTYDSAPLDHDADFKFTVPLNDFETFVDVLETITIGFDGSSEGGSLNFWDDVEQFAEDVKFGKTTAFCPDLVEAYWNLVDYLEELDGEEMEDDEEADE